MIQRAASSTDSRPHRCPDGPVRTCVGCRKRELAVDLLRVVAVSTERGVPAVVVDAAGTRAGRGAWLHPAPSCLAAAVRRRAFARALRITGSPDLSGVDEHFERLDAAGEGSQQNR